jgi:hypothetical protein
MRCVATLIAAIAMVSAGCGYVDDNPHAGAVVAQAYLDAFTARNAHAICRVLAPEVRQALATGRTCEAALAPQLRRRYPRLTVGSIHKVPSPPLNPRFAVEIPAQPGRVVIVGRYGSTWRVVDGGKNT